MNEIKKDLPNERSQKRMNKRQKVKKENIKKRKKKESGIGYEKRTSYVVTARISQGDMINVSTSYGKFHTSPPSDSSLDGKRAFLAM